MFSMRYTSPNKPTRRVDDSMGSTTTTTTTAHAASLVTIISPPSIRDDDTPPSPVAVACPRFSPPLDYHDDVVRNIVPTNRIVAAVADDGGDGDGRIPIGDNDRDVSGATGAYHAIPICSLEPMYEEEEEEDARSYIDELPRIGDAAAGGEEMDAEDDDRRIDCRTMLPPSDDARGMRNARHVDEGEGGECGERSDECTARVGPTGGEDDEVDYYDMDGGTTTAADGMQNIHIVDAAFASDDVIADDSFKYQRSTSMEPMVDAVVPDRRSRPFARLMLPPGRKSPVVGRTESSPRSMRDVDCDARTNSSSTTSKRPYSPITHDVAAQPATSPVSLDINKVRAVDGFVTETIPLGSPHSGVADSDIGGDRYFDLPCDPPDGNVEPRCDIIGDDEEVHVTLPPRLNRTILPKFPCNPPPAVSSSPVPLSPRPTFTQTHSLLDDCSDDDDDDDDDQDEMTTFTIVDSPTRHIVAYTCLAGPRGDDGGGISTLSSLFEVQDRGGRHVASGGSTATRKASNNIQHALLRTRHRRWDCQSSLAGSHAQSKEVFDVSNRYYCISGHPPGEIACGLSVAVEAIRVAALASGLWRTVKLVRLPMGLFVDRSVADHEIRTLLRCIASTFPMLNSIDFCGDIFRLARSDRRDEIVSCVMECLPNIAVIDGFVVKDRVFEVEARTDDESITGSENSTNSFFDISINRQRGNHGSAESSAPSIAHESFAMTEDDIDNGSNSRFSEPNHEETTYVSKIEQVDAAEGFAPHGSRNKASTAGVRPSTVHKSQPKKIDLPSHELFDDELKKSTSPTSSMLSSSLSWGSNASDSRPPICGTRPPTCPTSASRLRSRLPMKPPSKKKTNGSIMKAGVEIKRRFLGLIPTVSMMDADIDDKSDDSEHEEDIDCPTDLL